MAEPESVNRDVDVAEGREVEALMSIAGGPGGMVHAPIHESITLAALINGNFGVPRGTNLKNVSTHDWEYVRGAVWNDDPACLLFADSDNDNRTYATLDAGKWYYWYTLGETQWRDKDEDRYRNPTGRSHYGDLQFLHCMACKPGESANETKRKVMVWLEIMYKLATGEGGISSGMVVKDTKLIEFCPPISLPPRWKPLQYLLSKDTSFRGVDIGRRAIGSIFHIIQDSYAIGHTRRTLLNPQDKQSDNPLQFKSGIADRWGAIENFHTYSGQDTNAHSHFDHSNDALTNASDLNDLSQFNGMLGCRMAIEKCQGLMALKQSGKKWEEGVKQFFDEEVLVLAPNASPANSQVW